MAMVAPGMTSVGGTLTFTPAASQAAATAATSATEIVQ